MTRNATGGAREVSEVGLGGPRSGVLAPRHRERYRMIVLSPDTPWAVQHAGGLIVDHSLAGWDVTVSTLARLDRRTLTILGAKSEPWGAASGIDDCSSLPALLVLDDAMINAHSQIRQMVTALVGSGVTQVLVWSEASGPAGPSNDADEVPPNFALQHVHHLSFAACAFKAHALGTTGRDWRSAHATEAFLALGRTGAHFDHRDLRRALAPK